MQSSPPTDPGTRTAQSIFDQSRYGLALSLEEAQICLKGKQPFVGVAPTITWTINQKQQILPYTSTTMFTRHQLSGPEVSALHAYEEFGHGMTVDDFLEGQRSGLAQLDRDQSRFTARLLSRKAYRTLMGLDNYDTGSKEHTNSEVESDGGVRLDAEAVDNAWDPLAITKERTYGPVPSFKEMRDMYLSGKPLSFVAATSNISIGEDGTRAQDYGLSRISNLSDNQSPEFDDLIQHKQMLSGYEPHQYLTRMSYPLRDMDENVAGGQRWLLVTPDEFDKIVKDPQCQAVRAKGRRNEVGSLVLQ